MKKHTPKIFSDQPKLTAADILRLTPHLQGWNKLCEIMLMGGVCDADLKRLILMESMRDKPRTLVLRKLIAQLLSRTRHQLMEALTAK